MKQYIGNILDYNGGIVRMLDSDHTLQPHYLGGANSKGDITFLAYEPSEINKSFLESNNLRFLTREEVARFFRGENMEGEKLQKPTAPKFTEEQKLEMISFIKDSIKDREANGESCDFLYETLNRLVAE